MKLNKWCISFSSLSYLGTVWDGFKCIEDGDSVMGGGKSGGRDGDGGKRGDGGDREDVIGGREGVEGGRGSGGEGNKGGSGGM